MGVVKPGIPKGTRDFLPEKMLRRQYVINIIKSVFEKYGYQPLETPSIERLDVLSGKYGEEGEQLMFKILKRGTGIEKVGHSLKEFTITNFRDIVDLGLRYDLTVPLCRVVAMYRNEITLPFKRYQIQPVWRADRPQKGRYREFYQCDADNVGSASMLADAETIALINEILLKLGFQKFKIKINNRKILSGLVEYAGVAADLGTDVCVAIDKFEKIGMDGVKAELVKREVPEAAIKKLLPVLEINGSPEAVLDEVGTLLADSQVGTEGVEELKELIGYLEPLGVAPENFTIDLYLARGLSYYTGPIFESVVEEPRIGSLSGGGRYDKLIGMFLGEDIPATGTTLGIERIIDVMTELNMLPEAKSSTKALVTVFDENTKLESLKLVKKLRAAGVNAEIFLDSANLKKQFKYANKQGIPFVIIMGPDEAAQNLVSLKNMTSGEQKQMALEEAVKFLTEN